MSTEPEADSATRVVWLVIDFHKGEREGVAYWGDTEEIARKFGGPVVRVELPA